MVIFDPAKDVANVAKHGVSLSVAEKMNLDDAVIVSSDRDGEQRFVAYGMVAGRMFVLVFTFRGEGVRAISLRKANKREKKLYTV